MFSELELARELATQKNAGDGRYEMVFTLCNDIVPYHSRIYIILCLTFLRRPLFSSVKEVSKVR
jgi:hypothetical protein